jgi:hypothetical protein
MSLTQPHLRFRVFSFSLVQLLHEIGSHVELDHT